MLFDTWCRLTGHQLSTAKLPKNFWILFIYFHPKKLMCQVLGFVELPIEYIFFYSCVGLDGIGQYSPFLLLSFVNKTGCGCEMLPSQCGHTHKRLRLKTRNIPVEITLNSKKGKEMIRLGLGNSLFVHLHFHFHRNIETNWKIPLLFLFIYFFFFQLSIFESIVCTSQGFSPVRVGVEVTRRFRLI